MAVLARVAMIAALATNVANLACGAPSIDDGTIGCGPGGSCPDGFSCSTNGLCYRGQRPDAPTKDSTIGDTRALDAAPITLDCASYCSAIAAACTGANQQYGSAAPCLASCPHFLVGATTDITGNTLGCRVYHTELARSNPSTHCIHAGPSGGGACGQPCEGFCSIAVAACPSLYTTTQCPTACASMSITPPYSASVQSGDSLSCRLYYATAAAADPATYCPDTGASSSKCQ